MTRTRTPGARHVALFPTSAMAGAFATAIREDGWWVTDVTHQQGRRKVEFTDSEAVTRSESPHMAFIDMLDSVGYYGSTTDRKATLDGHRAPMTY